MTALSPRTAVPPPHGVPRALPLGPNAALVVTAGGQGPALATVTGELDLACADDFRAVLCSAVEEFTQGLRLDMAGVEFFDCAALTAFGVVRRHAEARGRPLTLERSSPAVDLVLRLAAAG